MEFIPKKTPRIAYIDTLKTDLDRLIYSCGGILGLWFGLTPIKLVDILNYLPLIIKILISKSIKFVHYLKAITIRLAQNSFGICKRFALFFIANIIIFAYNLITIFMRFVRHLFGLNSREN